jgi:transposase
MSDRKHHTTEKKAMIVGMRLAGLRYRQIADIMGLPISTIGRIIDKYHKEGTVVTSPRTGRPRKLSQRDKRSLARTLVQDRRVPLAVVAEQLPVVVCRRTLQNAVHELGFSNRVAVKKPLLAERHIAHRLKIAREHRHWGYDEWARVMWTDEAAFELGKRSNRVTVWRKAYEKYDWDCIVPTFRSGRKSVMVWGAITATSRSPLVLMPADERTASDFVRNVYEDVLSNYWLSHDGDGYVLMEDGAAIHRSKVSAAWREEIGLTKLDWPATSPDLNPIEHLWYQIKCLIEKKERPTRQEFMFAQVEEAWNELPQENIEKLIRSMPDRMEAVIKMGGKSTRF